MGGKQAKQRGEATEEKKAADPVPQSAFVIGGDEEDASPAGEVGAGQANGEATDKESVRPQMVESVKRDPIYVAEKNKSKIDSFASSGDLYQAFEAGIPIQLLDYRDFEGRIKKLVFDRQTITIRQLQYVMARDFDDFVDLVDPESDISKIIISQAFEVQAKNDDEEEKKAQDDDVDHMGKHVDITRLLLFGLLYCKGKHAEKCERFWDILQQPGMDQISWEDKELTVAGTWLLEMATHWVHVWSHERKPEGAKDSKVKEAFGDKAKMKELSDEIYQNFLDDIFGNASRIYRDAFISEIVKNCQYLFEPQ